MEKENITINNEIITRKGKVVNVTSQLRIRQSASTTSTILCTIVNSSVFDIISKNGSWYKIKYNEIIGYVHENYVEEITITKGKVYNVSTSLRVRSLPSTNSSILGYLINNTTVNIVGSEDEWYKIQYNDEYGYVSKTYITINNNSSNSTQYNNNNTAININKTGYVYNVNSGGLRVRKEPSTNSVILGTLYVGDCVNIVDKTNNWYKIMYNSSYAYVYHDYIKVSTEGDINSNTNVSNAYHIVLEELKSHIGSPYAYGGSGELVTRESIQILKNRFPDDATKGNYDTLYTYIDKQVRMFDCSGFMQWGFNTANINIGRTTYNQIKSGVEVSLDNLQPGDLLFNKTLGHVGMYIGNGQWIEAPHSGKTIRITNVPWKSIGRARRVL